MHWIRTNTPTMLVETKEEAEEKAEEEEEESMVATSGTNLEERKKRLVVIPYIRGFTEELRRVFGGYGTPTYFKPLNTLRQLLVHPKDPVWKDKIVGPVLVQN